MRPWTVLLTSAVFCAGCTHIKLEQRTVNQASTLADLQYRQVLDNLAMFLCNKDSLAWHLRLAGGTVQVADQGFVSVLANTVHKAQVSPTVTAQRTGVGQWDVDPAVDADDLELLQLAYQKSVDPADPMIDRRIDEAICELCIRFDLLPNQNALNRLFAAGDAVTKILEALDSVCWELEELDKLVKYEKPKDGKAPTEVPTVITKALLSPCPKTKTEEVRLNRIIQCILSRDKDNIAQNTYNEHLRADLVKRKLDLFRAWQLITNEILRPPGRGKYERTTTLADTGHAQRVAMWGGTQPLPAASKYLVLLVMHLICDPGYTPPAADPEVTRRNVGLIAQAEDKIQKLEQLIENPKFGTSWFHCGGAKDVPKCACYVGHYCNCGCNMYVWVMPEQLEVLKDFVLVVLGLAPIDKQDILSGYPSGRGTQFSPAYTSGKP